MYGPSISNADSTRLDEDDEDDEDDGDETRARDEVGRQVARWDVSDGVSGSFTCDGRGLVGISSGRNFKISTAILRFLRVCRVHPARDRERV